MSGVCPCSLPRACHRPRDQAHRRGCARARCRRREPASRRSAAACSRPEADSSRRAARDRFRARLQSPTRAGRTRCARSRRVTRRSRPHRPAMRRTLGHVPRWPWRMCAARVDPARAHLQGEHDRAHGSGRDRDGERAPARSRERMPANASLTRTTVMPGSPARAVEGPGELHRAPSRWQPARRAA